MPAMLGRLNKGGDIFNISTENLILEKDLMKRVG
jgi:hypothetical protein